MRGRSRNDPERCWSAMQPEAVTGPDAGTTGAASVRREAVVFRNRDGLKLFGILHRPPPAAERDVGVVFLSPGVKTRVAPHRLYNKMTESLLRQGYPVLRFDFYGLGDSEGELSEPLLADLYASVQDGRYVEDTFCAMDWMQQRLGVKRFVLAGLCGGALTGIIAAGKDRRAQGILALGLPVGLDGRTPDVSRFMTRGQLDRIGEGYMRKLIKPGAWLRLLTFRTDYRMQARALSQKIFGRRPGKPTPVRAEGEIPSNLNPLFVPACFDFLARGGRLLLVFSGADRLAWEFDEKFAQPYAERLGALGASYEVHTIPNANHILSDPRWRREMQEISDAWLAAHFR